VSEGGLSGQYAAAVYGSILVTGLIGSLRYDEDARTIVLTVLGTSAVFWLAHVWSELLAHRIETGQLVGWARVRRVAAVEWPMIEAGILPVVAVALAWAGVYSVRAGTNAALVVAIGQLVAWTLVAALRSGLGRAKSIAFALLDGLLGLGIVALELALH